MAMLPFVLLFVLAFLLGSIPFGLIVGKVVQGTDIRTVGSGNIGTTNAIRAMGLKWGAVVFLLDFGKGLASGALALLLLWYAVPGGGLDPGTFPAHEDFLALAFFGCIAGHVFSPWLEFKGGKGIAVAVGCMFITHGVVWALVEIAIFAALVVLTRYVSLGSIASAVFCVPLSIYLFWGHPVAAVLASAGALLVVWAHRGNISRLLSGTENRIGGGKGSQGEG